MSNDSDIAVPYGCPRDSLCTLIRCCNWSSKDLTIIIICCCCWKKSIAPCGDRWRRNGIIQYLIRTGSVKPSLSFSTIICCGSNGSLPDYFKITTVTAVLVPYAGSRKFPVHRFSVVILIFSDP